MNTQYTKQARQAVANAEKAYDKPFGISDRKAVVWFDSYWFEYVVQSGFNVERYRTAASAAEALDTAWTTQQ